GYALLRGVSDSLGDRNGLAAQWVPRVGLRPALQSARSLVRPSVVRYSQPCSIGLGVALWSELPTGSAEPGPSRVRGSWSKLCSRTLRTERRSSNFSSGSPA